MSNRREPKSARENELPRSGIQFSTKSLTWDDLNLWAGSRGVQRGRNYQRRGRVSQLGISSDGRLLAWVRGGTRYAVCVGFVDGELFSDCTCPYDFGPACKHAVAVLLDYLQQLKRRRTVEVVADDELWALFADKDNAPQTGDWDVEA